MKFEKTWRKIIPQMIAAAFEDGEKHYRRNRNPIGTAFCYIKDMNNVTFSALDDIMLANRVNYIGHYYKENKSTVFKLIIIADVKSDDPIYPYKWVLEPVTDDF